MYDPIRQLLLALGCFFLALYPVSAQDTAWHWRRPNVLKTNLAAPVSMIYERALTPRFALRTSVRWWQFGIVSKDVKFVNATIEGKFYTRRQGRLMTGEHPAGFFISPYLKARSLRYVNEIGYGTNKTGDLDEVKVQSIGMGLTMGYMWVLKRHFVLELVHGGGFFPDAFTRLRHTMQYSNVTSDSGQDLLRMDLRTGIHLGYAF